MINTTSLAFKLLITCPVCGRRIAWVNDWHEYYVLFNQHLAIEHPGTYPWACLHCKTLAPPAGCPIRKVVLGTTPCPYYKEKL